MKTTLVFLAIAVGVAGCSGQNKLVAPDCHGDTQQANAAGLRPVVWDNQRDTFLSFPGNMPLPSSITVLRPDGKEGAVNRTTDPDTGVVRVHGVHPGIVLRDGARVACIRNKAYDPVGVRPPGGHSS